ncbi:RNA-directed DNA polymerase, partial [bacterium]|nr:RNA-directed DNA polymerase [bacterium]
MDGTDYQLLKRNLPLDVAIEWLTQDCKDDFYPDPLNFSDIKTYPEEYLRNREHRILQIHTLPYRRESVPKKSGMLREAIWLHPSHRILYLAILRHLLGKLDSKLLPVVYSYRLDEPDDLDKYPFSKSRERWKLFNNDFREAALDPSTEAVLITDLVSFFDHINCNQLCNRILSMLGTSIDQIDEAVIGLLKGLLNMWSHEGDGIPQNYDPSSFFGSLYLHNVDNEMVTRRYRYFRWADDVRVVAKSERQALRALHDLQIALQPYKLFLATEKTAIIPKDDPRFKKLLDVEDERRISKAEEILMSGDCTAIRSILDQLFERLAFHSGPDGDEKKLRAFANRLLDAADYTELKPLIHPRLQEFVIPRFESHP